MRDARSGPRTSHVDLGAALESLERQAGPRYLQLFRHGSLVVELYAPRGHDPQAPHSRDEVYVVASGSGLFFDGLSRRPFGPGSFLFVAAGQPHRFEDFSADFAAWVFFYGPEGGEIAEQQSNTA